MMSHLAAADTATADTATAERALVAAPSDATPSAPHVVPSSEAARNRLLGALPVNELTRLRPHLERVQIEQRTVLFDANQPPITHVYFPETCVVSLISTLHHGGAVEVGTVGCEGMAGLP
ncbi:MAG TPA: hypothetical protein VHM67_10350, partial [Gemmatimonadaceae bacterium]|nr:hypothetical protein [Gemmatimonadaceae bacterium]